MDNRDFEVMRAKLENNTAPATVADMTKLASALLTHAYQPTQERGHGDLSRRRDCNSRVIFMLAAEFALNLSDTQHAPSYKEVMNFVNEMRGSLPRPVKGDVAWPSEIGSQKVSGNTSQIKFYDLAGGRQGISIDGGVVLYAD